MKKNVFLTIICAICALAITFVACKKETEEGTKSINKAITSVNGVYDAATFDKTATYYVGTGTTFSPISITGNGSFYNIFSKNVATEELYSSFCGNRGSGSFGEWQYAYYVKTAEFMVEKPGIYEKILLAFNYICENYGGVNVWLTDGGLANKAVAGMVVYAIMDPTLIPMEMTNDGGWGVYAYPDPAVNDAVTDVLANYESYNGPTHVTELVILADENYPKDVHACQPQIIPLKGTTPVAAHGQIHLNKVKIVNGAEVLAEEAEFEFRLYKKNTEGNYVECPCNDEGEEICHVYPLTCHVETGDWGTMNINFYNLCPGEYVIKEKNYVNWAMADVYFTINENGGLVIADQTINTTRKIVNNPVLGPAYGSVTATWYDMPAKTYLPRINATLNPKNGNAQFPASYLAGVVYNANHFCYAKVNHAALLAGEVIELAMVVGNKFDHVGKAFVSLKNGNIEVTIENFGKGNFGIMAFNKPMTSNFPKNGNIHSQKEADLKKELGATTGFDHNNKTVVPCPGPATDGNIYLYIHCGTIQFFL
jgi:hypothetical protein